MDKRENPKFSIIIGTYNQLDTLKQLIESLKEQTVQDFEVHICDDGSNDGTKAWAEDFVNKTYMKAYYHRQRDKGMRLAKNVNQGIKKAKGDYCLFIMADSFLEKDFLEWMEAYAQPQRVLCGVRYQIDGDRAVDADWRLKRNIIPPENVLLIKQVWKQITGNGMLIPTQAMRLHGGWNEKIKGYGGDDYEIASRLYYKGYTFWSIVDAKVYHNWHKATTENPDNEGIVHKLIRKYESQVYS